MYFYSSSAVLFPLCSPQLLNTLFKGNNILCMKCKIWSTLVNLQCSVHMETQEGDVALSQIPTHRYSESSNSTSTQLCSCIRIAFKIPFTHAWCVVFKINTATVRAHCPSHGASNSYWSAQWHYLLSSIFLCVLFLETVRPLLLLLLPTLSGSEVKADSFPCRQGSPSWWEGVVLIF